MRSKASFLGFNMKSESSFLDVGVRNCFVMNGEIASIVAQVASGPVGPTWAMGGCG